MLKPQSPAEFNNWTRRQKKDWILFDTKGEDMADIGVTLLYTEPEPNWIIIYAKNENGQPVNIHAEYYETRTRIIKERRLIQAN